MRILPRQSEIVADQVRFETELFQSVNQVEFQKLLQKCNKFVAHLDEEKKGHIPHMYVAEASVRFYHKYISDNEAQPGDLAGLPVDLSDYHRECEKEAEAIFNTSAS